jgi:hypothetical protein
MAQDSKQKRLYCKERKKERRAFGITKEVTR